jgi:hypothetical protein
MAGMFARILPASKGIRLPLRENGDRTACAKDGGLELSRSCGLRKSYSSELFESGQWYLAQSLRKKTVRILRLGKLRAAALCPY